MGCCSSAAPPEKEDTKAYPLPVISATNTNNNSTIFDPEFSTSQPKKGKPESVPLLEDNPSAQMPVPKRVDDSSDTSSVVDSDIVSKLLAEVDTTDFSD